MRHASSPTKPPDVTNADPNNPQLERQLDDKEGALMVYGACTYCNNHWYTA
jgi:hypothetical protein